MHLTDLAVYPLKKNSKNKQVLASPSAKGSFHVSDDSYLDSFDVPLDPNSSQSGLTPAKKRPNKKQLLSVNWLPTN